MKARVWLLALALALPAAAQEERLEFDPQVGMTGTRVTLTSPLPKGAVVRFGARVVPLLAEPGRRPSFVVPEGATSSFIEASLDGKPFARSAVPFVVAGASLVGVQKLIGLREAIDVFGYSDPTPEGGGAPEQRAKKVLSFGDSDLITIGEAPAPAPIPWVIGNDAASAAMRGMGPPGFLLTARPPTRRVIVIPPPPPVPTPVPTPTPSPATS
ncbi:MAG TPA: hypothetical protein PKA62_10095 [Thermoanaerobaculia bacterium]|nr:hypothetical protein [Thermoanaerobaculia bacterium]